MRIFGCLCFPLTKPINSNKLKPKSTKCLFLGYSLAQNAYICRDLSTGRVYYSKHVLFNEEHFPFQKRDQPTDTDQVSCASPSTSGAPAHLVLPPFPPVLPPPELTPISPSPGMGSPLSSSFSQTMGSSPSNLTSENLLHQNPTPDPSTINQNSPPNPAPQILEGLASQRPNPSHQRTHNMNTRAMNNIHKPKQLHLVSKHPLPPSLEPTCKPSK